LWDAIGTEFGGRHELYERNHAGGWEDIRAQTLTGARRGGDPAAMEALVDQCMADYDSQRLDRGCVVLSGGAALISGLPSP
jgi:4-hydroxyphenylacetate 3-monooxygenase